MYDKKILISGCGLSWSGQERRTWVTILKSLGLRITDVGGPAVSNQWVLNQAILNRSKDIDTIVVQITSLGKLDVEVTPDRELVLVQPDSRRNFTYKGVWPSSVSQDHQAKRLWTDLLFSPMLEKQDIICKSVLLNEWCRSNGIELHIVQGYHIDWTLDEKKLIDGIIDYSQDLYTGYESGEYYYYHDHTNTVPCVPYQCQIAKRISSLLGIDLTEKINSIERYSKDRFFKENNL